MYILVYIILEKKMDSSVVYNSILYSVLTQTQLCLQNSMNHYDFTNTTQCHALRLVYIVLLQLE